jgi:pilus assembly protein Flp/PilA
MDISAISDRTGKLASADFATPVQTNLKSRPLMTSVRINAEPSGSRAERIWTKAGMLKFLKNNRGATAIEYGLIAALIAVAAIPAIQLLGQNQAMRMVAAAFGMSVNARDYGN